MVNDPPRTDPNPAGDDAQDLGQCAEAARSPSEGEAAAINVAARRGYVAGRAGVTQRRQRFRRLAHSTIRIMMVCFRRDSATDARSASAR